MGTLRHVGAKGGDANGERGFALLITLLALGLCSTVAAGLAVNALLIRSVGGNYDDALALGNYADAALDLALRELAAIPDWDDVLSGARASSLVDGAPGVRVLAGGNSIDLPVLTNELTCGRVTPCTPAQISQFVADRPWGPNNARWQLFLHIPAPALPPMPRPQTPAYLVVWIGDDGRETDDNPVIDGAGAGGEGRYVVRAHVEAFSAGGGRHVLEAELRRVCTGPPGAEVCAPGVRVHSWRPMTAGAG